MWTKGPRCGVDNCPSRFWQVLEGSQVCQYGHVREGVEVGEDEDDFIHGRRIKRPKLNLTQEEKESKAAYGRDAEIILADTLQKVLQLQLKHLLDNHITHSAYAMTVKMLWLAFVKGTKIGKPNKPDSKLSLSPRYTISILYLACVKCQIPVYLVDFWRMIYRYELPYFNALEVLIATKKQDPLPPNLIDRLNPRHLPGYDRLFTDSRTLAAYFEKQRIHFPEVMPGPLVFKLVRDLLLPPMVYEMVLRLLKLMTARLGLTASKHGNKALSPENLVVCTTIVAVKLCYGLDGVERGRNPESPSADEFDWALWNDLVTKLWLLDDEHTYADERQTIYWDSDRIDRYLKWFRQYVNFSGDTREPSVVMKRLYNMFPLPEITDQSEDLGSKDYDTVVPELVAALHASSELQNREGPGPGSNYKQYSNTGQADWQLPEYMETLYLVGARFLNVSMELFRSMVYRVESYLRVANHDIFVVMEHTGDVVWRPAGRLPVDKLAKRRSTMRARQRLASTVAAYSTDPSVSPSPIRPSPFQSFSEDDTPPVQSHQT